MTKNDLLHAQRAKLIALKRKVSIAEAAYKTGFVFFGRRVSVAQAKMEIEFLTNQINNNGESNNSENGHTKETQGIEG